jgi:hypothetical protein
MSHFGRSRVLAAAAALCLLPAAVIAQQQQRQMPLPQDLLKQARSMPTPMTADGHPDLSGLWNGLGDPLVGSRNQLSNAGIEVAADTTEDIYTETAIATDRKSVV